MLLSSLQGAAITSVKINGVLHEFSTIPGVMEDVSDIVLNLKEVRMRLHGEGPKTRCGCTRRASRIVITAADLVAEDSAVEVLNPDHKIATLSPEADVEMEAHGQHGKGYVPAEKNKTEEMPIGTIPIDSIFSPVRKVNYNVTPARVGSRDGLRPAQPRDLDGRHVPPVDAVAYAAKILKEQLTIFINFEEPTEMPMAPGRGARAAEPEPLQVGGRAGAVGALGQLPPERQHPASSASWCSGPRARCSRPRTSGGSP